jgi:hypothetical protein
MNAPLGIERQLQLASDVLFRCGLERGNQPSFKLNECIHLEVGMDSPQHVRASITLGSATGQKQ